MYCQSKQADQGKNRDEKQVSLMDKEFVYWPFPILKAETTWNGFDRDFIEFMQSAYAERFRPRHRDCMEVEADSETGRSIFLAFRGVPNGWEPWLRDGDEGFRLGPLYDLPLGDSACVCVRPPFRAAAHLALEWLRGRTLQSLLNDFNYVGGRPPGIELHLPDENRRREIKPC